MRHGVRAAVVVSLALAGACGSDGHTTTQPVPRAVRVLESRAEDLVDLVRADDWPRATAAAAELGAAWHGYRDGAPLRGGEAATVDRSIVRLDRALGAHAAGGAAQAANDVSRVVVELMHREGLRVPVEIGRLDVIGRQVQLDAGEVRSAALARDGAAAHRQFRRVRDRVARRDERVAALVGRTVDTIEDAVARHDPAAADRAAGRLLALVDRMEQLWR